MFEKSYLSESRNYWFIRSGRNSGEFFNHFIDNTVIAIGHSDRVDFNFDNGHMLSKDDKDNIISAVKRNMADSGRKPSEIGNTGGQLTRFLKDMKIDDIVITVNSDNKIVAGKVISNCYYGTTGLVRRSRTAQEDSSGEACYYSLRADIKWGKRKDRNMLPFPVEKTLRTPLTVAHLDNPEQVSALNHWLFPIHFTENEVRCTLKIATPEHIPNRQLTKLSMALDELELLAGYIAEQADLSNLGIDGYDQFITNNENSFNYTLTAQHLFMSPGYQFLQFPGGRVVSTAFASFFIYIFSPGAVALEDLVPVGMEQSQFIELANHYKQKVPVDDLRHLLDVGLPASDLSASNDSIVSSSDDDGFGDGEPIEASML
ncbi:hypothetical protein VCR4J2_530051 [Vibrio coralliirubri]|uniref:hypothetical protein n=1 Tax=Vibrio coralliirubri TaxID=1516159 RepID=UPI000630A655|nr:hypothetical protein [Vibrio coralliirubri]CDT43289.1 hypothetical protein VCR4J2_530051 [Vibrio coralliirubri]